MTVKIVIGLDGTETGDRALNFAKDLASQPPVLSVTGMLLKH